MSNLPVSSASAGVGRACYRHPDASGTHTCGRCRRSVCEGCLSLGSTASLGFAEVCSGCADEGRRRSRAIMAASVVGAFALVAGAIAFVASRPPTIEYGEHRFEIERLVARVALTKCDGQSTLELVDLLNKERDYPRVIRLVDEFQAGCKPLPRLAWESYGARMQVQDFAGAAADASRLIADDADDGDFWWWRAKARRQSGDLKGAEADMRRAAEISGKNAFWSVLDLADVLEEQGRACEGVPLLAEVTRNHAEQAKKGGLDARLARLIRETPCPDARAAMPPGEQPVAALCQALPSQLLVDDQGTHKDVPTSGFEMSLANAWQARTRTVATGKPVSCRADVEQNSMSGSSILKDTGMQSWTGRLICDGLPSSTATAVSVGGLLAQEQLVGKLIDNSIKRWCHPGG